RPADLRRKTATPRRRHMVGSAEGRARKPWPRRRNRAAQRSTAAGALGSTQAGGRSAARCGPRRVATVVPAGHGAIGKTGHAPLGPAAVLVWGGRRRHSGRGRQVSGGWSSKKLAARVSGARAGRGVATAAERQRGRQSSCSGILAPSTTPGPPPSRDGAAIQPVTRRATSWSVRPAAA